MTINGRPPFQGPADQRDEANIHLLHLTHSTDMGTPTEHRPRKVPVHKTGFAETRETGLPSQAEASG